MNIDDILDGIIRDIEGGFVDDPDDPGGPTNHGISLRYARGIGLDLDKDGDTDRDDIMLVTMEGARMYMKQDFYYSPGVDKLPEDLRPVMLDMNINHGSSRATMILQEVLNKLGSYDLYVDGRSGPKTRKAAVHAHGWLGMALVDLVCDAREAFYYSLAGHNPGSFLKYVRAKDGGIGGWIKRARMFRSDA